VEGQERTGTWERKNSLTALGCWTWQPPLLRLMLCPVQGGAALRVAIHDEFGSYSTGAMWRSRFSYLEVAMISVGAGDLSSSSLGDGVGGGGLRCTSGDGEDTNGRGGLR
jgi:hypothetical protein